MNNSQNKIFTFFLICILSGSVFSLSAQKLKGVTLVAPPNEYASNPILPLNQIGVNYIKVVPYGFTNKGKTNVTYNVPRQWWGEKEEGVVKTIKLAHQDSIGVMLKPQIYIPGGWVGDLDFKTESEWLEWESNYREYIFHFVDIAVRENIEIFCIGTEFKVSIEKRSEFWLELITDIRKEFCGKLTYSANWDNYKRIKFWNELDYIGVSSYFPLSEQKTPTVSSLVKAWQPTVKELRNYSKKLNVPILFTEYGYLSVDGCAGNTWELEKKVHPLNINEQAQANAIEALYTVFWEEDFWAGGFMWKWFPEGQGHEGYIERDYTPQDKISIQVMQTWFEKKDK